jgi:uncharacterized protein YwqG
MAAAYVVPNADELARMSIAELTQAYVDGTQAAQTTEHVGRLNRLARHRENIKRELGARGEAHRVFRRLADHSDPSVRSSAKSYLDWLDKPRPDVTPARQRPLPAQFCWQCDHSPPPALARDQIAERLHRSVRKVSDRLMKLALPAIGLWPQRRPNVPATTSRFGGKPLAPPDWQWPIVQEEPLLFVGQINCSEMRGLPGAEALPASGLLAFFGDHDALIGGFPFGDHCVFYWPDLNGLAPPVTSIEPLEVFSTCAVVPRPIVDLPHPHSRAVRDLGLNEQQQKAYCDIWTEIRDDGIPRDHVSYVGFSKLLGWPGLVQSDLMAFDSRKKKRLLLQIDKYCNGEKAHDWGPGGTLYYYLSQSDLRAGRFERCELEGQFT